jgi:hypothetical protein
MTETIQQLKEDIAILQEKLNKLEEIEKQPKMHLENEGEFSLVSYDGNVYYRLRFPLWVYWYRKTRDDCCGLEYVEDIKTRNQLESVWNNEVITQNDEEPYCPDEPEYYDEVEWDEKDNPKPMNEVMNRLENKYKDAEENAASYMTDEVIDRMVKKYQAQKLWNRVRDELGYSIDCCDEIVDLVEKWLPDPQSAAGSQNVDVEFLVDGFNDCVRKMREMLR